MSKEEILNKSYNSLIKYLDWNIECEKDIKEVISYAIDQTREETIGGVEEILDDYFKGLIMIPIPELTLNKIKQELNKLKK